MIHDYFSVANISNSCIIAPPSQYQTHTFKEKKNQIANFCISTTTTPYLNRFIKNIDPNSNNKCLQNWNYKYSDDTTNKYRCTSQHW